MQSLISRFRALRLAFYALYRPRYLGKTSELGVYKAERHPIKSLINNRIAEVRSSLNSRLFELTAFRHFKNMFANGNEENVPTYFKKYVPNDAARGMKKLDKSVFNCVIKVLGIAVPDCAVAQFRKVFKTSIVRLPNVKPVANLSDSDPLCKTHKLIMLDPIVYNNPEDFASKHSEELEKMSVDHNLCKFYDLELDYKNWNYDEILKWILPNDTDAVGGFSVIGHIAHLNLKDELLEYKEVIGQVILDKVPSVKTVVNKLHTIDNTFRNFQMEMLAGEENYVTIAKEHGFTYELDFSKIYWNPRLSTEHQRISDLASHGDIVFDVFAGVGPFSIPCAKEGCQVYANDLNPNSVFWLNKNLKHNKIKGGQIDVFNMDGREFIRNVVRKELLKLLSSADGLEIILEKTIHIPMNLPALAIDFLDAFPGLLAENSLDVECQSLEASGSGLDIKSILEKTPELSDRSKLVIHCYCFSKEKDPESDAVERIKNVLKVDSLSFHEAGIKRVRNVAPNKEMLCVSFKLPWDLLLRKSQDLLSDDSESAEPKPKKIKL